MLDDGPISQAQTTIWSQAWPHSCLKHGERTGRACACSPWKSEVPASACANRRPLNRSVLQLARCRELSTERLATYLLYGIVASSWH